MLRAGLRSPGQLASKFGSSPQTLRNWPRQDQADRGERDEVLRSEERQAAARARAQKQCAASGAGDPEAAAAFFAR